APNAPSKEPSTKDTSSSSIDYIPKSPTSSTSLLPNGYLNPPTSPPLRVSPPPQTQENASMDITLTLSPITPLDVQFDTPSPSPPILGHPIPWNLLDVLEEWSRAKRAPRNQENRIRENTRRVVPVEITNSNALVSCDGSGYDWSDQAEEGPTNFALVAYSSTSSNSEVSTDSNCSSSCLENVKILKEQNGKLLKDLRTSKLNAIAYKTGLESLEARLLVYKINESVYEEDIKVLKCEIHLREVAITELRRKLELAQKQKDEIQLTVENFENSSKSLSKLIDCQIVDKCKTGLGYNVVPPPYTRNFMPPKPDLSFFGLEEFVNDPIVSEPTVKKPVVESSEAKASADKPKVVMKNFGPPLIEEENC
ncbi:hypothetical protein Tco_1013824, partial [Tanacetum coccineum]